MDEMYEESPGMALDLTWMYSGGWRKERFYPLGASPNHKIKLFIRSRLRFLSSRKLVDLQPQPISCHGKLYHVIALSIAPLNKSSGLLFSSRN